MAMPPNGLAAGPVSRVDTSQISHRKGKLT
jgi:hypothetical protein